MNKHNLIEIEGGEYNDIKKALKQWINIDNDLSGGLTFTLYTNGKNKHYIQADERLCNDNFFSLINYLMYPENIEYKIDIKGFTVGKNNNKLKNKEMMIFIPSTDEEYDNVYIVTSDNENYKIDFGRFKIKDSREKRIYRQPTDLPLENPEILTVDKSELKQKHKYYVEDFTFKGYVVIVVCVLLLVAVLSFLMSFISEYANYVYAVVFFLLLVFLIFSKVKKKQKGD
jgi:hypothetical protein